MWILIGMVVGLLGFIAPLVWRLTGAEMRAKALDAECRWKEHQLVELRGRQLAERQKQEERPVGYRESAEDGNTYRAVDWTISKGGDEYEANLRNGQIELVRYHDNERFFRTSSAYSGGPWYRVATWEIVEAPGLRGHLDEIADLANVKDLYDGMKKDRK